MNFLNSLVVQWLGLGPFTVGAWVGELRSLELSGMAQKIIKKKKEREEKKLRGEEEE